MDGEQLSHRHEGKAATLEFRDDDFKGLDSLVIVLEVMKKDNVTVTNS
jgi:hypothetical protein